MCDLSHNSQLSQLLRTPSLTEKLSDTQLVHLLGFLEAEVWDNRDGNRQVGNVRATQDMTGREGISCSA